MKNPIRRFAIVFCIVIGLVCLLDMSLGKVMNWMLPQISNQGDTGKTYYALNDVQSPVVIVGSSRAAHHYVSSMISDSLGYETYNVGRDGCFFSYNCCVINSILDRYSPKLIIWENSLGCLYESGADPLESLHPYYGKNPWVTVAVDEEYLWNDRLPLNSNIYKYNSILHRILSRFIARTNFTDRTKSGYDPLVPRTIEMTLDNYNHPTDCISSIKENRLYSVLKRTHDRGVQVVMVDSPVYGMVGAECESKSTIQDICDKFDVRLIDNRNLELFLSHPEWFNDRTHLNDNGAKEYTRTFINQMLGK